LNLVKYSCYKLDQLNYNKILVSGILISIFTLIIFLNNQVEVKGSSDPGQSAFLQKRAGFSLYNNTEYGFQILYPQDWNVIEGDSEPGDYVTDIVFFEPLGEKGKHFSKNHACGEVCLVISADNSAFGGLTLQQYSDSVYNNLKAGKGQSKSLDFNSNSKLGDKKAFEMLDQVKQGNREYIIKFIGTPYPDPDANESKTFLNIQFKTRDKYSDEMLPLGKTMIDSFRFTKNSTQ
jgi:hypothetical protein